MRRQWKILVHELTERAPMALDWRSVRTIKVLRGHTDCVRSCAFAPDGSTLVTTSEDNTVRVWCTRDWSHLHTLTSHTRGVRSYVTSCAFAPDGSTLVTTSNDNTARVWCTRDWSHLQTLTGHTSFVMSCVFAPNVSTLVTTSIDLGECQLHP